VRDALADLPLARFEGKIHIIESVESMVEHLPRLLGEELLGFDTETRPAFRRGERYRPALVQLACSRDAYIFRLNPLGGLPKPLVELLQIRRPLKVGIGLAQDIAALRGWGEITCSQGALLDLVPLAQKLGFPRPNLRTLAAELLGIRVSKKARLTNWENPKLTEAQIHYAAVDAWISRELALRLLELNKKFESGRGTGNSGAECD
jgi:ribonuclease D